MIVATLEETRWRAGSKRAAVTQTEDVSMLRNLSRECKTENDKTCWR